MTDLSYLIMIAALPSLTHFHFHCHHRMYNSSNTLAPPQLRRDTLPDGDLRQRFVSHKVS